MASSVTAPLERQFGLMPGLTLMTSTSSSGSSVITLQFSLDLSLDVAEQQVQAADQRGLHLPSVGPADPSCLQQSEPGRRAHPDARPYLEDPPPAAGRGPGGHAVCPENLPVPGVGLVSISGGQRPAVRVQVNPTALAAYDLTLEDVRTALAAANVNQAKGSFDGPRQAYIIGADDQLFSSSEYKPLIIAYRNNAPVKSVRRRRDDRRCGERAAGRVDEQYARR